MTTCFHPLTFLLMSKRMRQLSILVTACLPLLAFELLAGGSTQAPFQ